MGPNTGGMGVYSPVPIVTDEEMAAMVSIMEDAAAATARAPFGLDYRGTLYGGFMLTPAGPKVVEFNARFGDPETQVVLPRLESDLVDVMLAVAEGRADDIDLAWSESWAVCVVLASEGYPGAYEKGQGHPRDRRGRGYRRRHGVPRGHQAQRRRGARHQRRARAQRRRARRHVRGGA